MLNYSLIDRTAQGSGMKKNPNCIYEKNHDFVKQKWITILYYFCN